MSGRLVTMICGVSLAITSAVFITVGMFNWQPRAHAATLMYMSVFPASFSFAAFLDAREVTLKRRLIPGHVAVMYVAMAIVFGLLLWGELVYPDAIHTGANILVQGHP